jgi:hypothetical protein
VGHYFFLFPLTSMVTCLTHIKPNQIIGADYWRKKMDVRIIKLSLTGGISCQCDLRQGRCWTYHCAVTLSRFSYKDRAIQNLALYQRGSN